MSQTIAACIVTFNRKDLLMRCLTSILQQEHLPDGIIIVDNVSVDSTFEEITTKRFPDLQLEKKCNYGDVYTTEKKVEGKLISIVYVRKNINDGGSGGFYVAMQEAYERNYDWLWLQDDDGVPDKKELKELYDKSIKYNLQYANALVLDIKDPIRFSFGLTKDKKIYTVEDAMKEPIIRDVANPFNGTFISRKVIDKIGLIKKEMFIWGDEVEYFLRTKKNGFNIATVPSAIHLHPRSVNANNYLYFFNWKIPDVAISRLAYVYRNKGYINFRYYGVCAVIKYFIVFSVVFISNFKLKKWLLSIKYYIEGIFNYYHK